MCVQMELKEPDASGRARPVPIPGSESVIPADTVIMATGQAVDYDGIEIQTRQSMDLHQRVSDDQYGRRFCRWRRRAWAGDRVCWLSVRACAQLPPLKITSKEM